MDRNWSSHRSIETHLGVQRQLPGRGGIFLEFSTNTAVGDEVKLCGYVLQFCIETEFIPEWVFPHCLIQIKLLDFKEVRWIFLEFELEFFSAINYIWIKDEGRWRRREKLGKHRREGWWKRRQICSLCARTSVKPKCCIFENFMRKCSFGSLRSIILEIFTSWKPANSTNSLHPDPFPKV